MTVIALNHFNDFSLFRNIRVCQDIAQTTKHIMCAIAMGLSETSRKRCILTMRPNNNNS